jgi:hypothetical protein
MPSFGKKGESSSNARASSREVLQSRAECPKSHSRGPALVQSFAARHARARYNMIMTGFTTKSTRRVLCCRYLGGRDLTLPRGAGATARRSTPGPGRSIGEEQGSLTYWPEGRRRGRAGGRQEYRHLSGLAQPYALPGTPRRGVEACPMRAFGTIPGGDHGRLLRSLSPPACAANFVPGP